MNSNDDADKYHPYEAFKNRLHGLGFRTFPCDINKLPIPPGGPKLRARGELTESTLRSKRFGAVHSTDFPNNYVFVDEDKVVELTDQKHKSMREAFRFSCRDKDGKISWHWLVEITDAKNNEEITKCARDFTKAGFIEAFHNGPRHMCIFGDYNIVKDGNHTSKWDWISENKKQQFESGEIPKCSISDFRALMTAIHQCAGITPKTTRNDYVDIHTIPAAKEGHDGYLKPIMKMVGRGDPKEAVKQQIEYNDMKRDYPHESKDTDKMIEGAEAKIEERRRMVMAGEAPPTTIEECAEYIPQHNHFSHLVNSPDQWNVSMWDDDNQWCSGGVAGKILGILRGLNPNGNYSSRMCEEIAKRISRDPTTLQVKIDEEYQRVRARRIYDPYGQFYDIPIGEVRKCDPSVDYFEEPDVKLRLNPDFKECRKYLAFLKARCGKWAWVVHDHKASTFLHNRDKGHKALAMNYIGPPDTYKSLVIEMMEWMFNSSINISQSDMGRDRFAAAVMANKMYCGNEEVRVKQPENPDIVKDLITATGVRKVRTMHKTDGKDVYRFPTCEFAGNALSPMGADEDRDSSHIRNNYVQMLPVGEYEPNWREELSEKDDAPNIMMMLLMRATEMYNHNGKPFRQQNIGEVRRIYDELTTGKLRQALEQRYQFDAGTCVQWDAFVHDMRRCSGTNLKKTTLEDWLPMVGLSKSRQHVESIDGRSGEYVISSSPYTSSLTVVEGLRKRPSARRELAEIMTKSRQEEARILDEWRDGDASKHI